MGGIMDLDEVKERGEGEGGDEKELRCAPKYDPLIIPEQAPFFFASHPFFSLLFSPSPFSSTSRITKPYHLNINQRTLYHQPFHLVFQAPDLSHQLAPLVAGDTSSDDGSTDAAGSPQRSLARHIDVRHVFVFAQER